MPSITPPAQAAIAIRNREKGLIELGLDRLLVKNVREVRPDRGFQPTDQGESLSQGAFWSLS